MSGRTLVRSLTLALALVAGPGAVAADPPRVSQTPITLLADQVAAWNEGGKRVVAFSGRVFVEQGVTQLRARQAVAWLDVPDGTRSRIARVTLYAEGSVAVENGSTSRTDDPAVLELATTGEVRVKATGGDIDHRSQAASPLYRRALVRLAGQADRPTAADAGSAHVDANVRPVQFTQSAAPPELAPPGTSPYQPLPVGPPTAVPAPSTAPVPAAAPAASGIGPANQITLPNAPRRTLILAQRSPSTLPQLKYIPTKDEEVLVVTNGVKLLARFQQGSPSQQPATPLSTGGGTYVLDVEADQLVVWRRSPNGPQGEKLLESLTRGSTQDDKSQIELYLSGNVILRFGSEGERRNADGSPVDSKTLRADQLYYDVGRNRAIAVQADLELQRTGLTQPAHFRGDEIWQLSQQEWRAIRTDANASKLPSDPGISISARETTIVEERAVRRTIFGLPYFSRETGEVLEQPLRTFESRNTFLEVAGVPVLWFPYLAGNAEDPLGPLQAVRFHQDRVFGTSVFTTWDVFDLIGTRPLAGERWNLFVDYMGRRGPALGTEYDYSGNRMFGCDSTYNGYLKGYLVYDQATDILGGVRQTEFRPPYGRGWLNWRHMQDLDDWQFQGQVTYESDPRFYEQYYKYQFDMGPNQETFGYLKWQQGNFAATGLIEPNVNRYWVNEAQWLPRLDGWLIGQSFLDRFTYNAWGSVGYASLRTSKVPPFPVLVTDRPTDTGRFDLMQELSMPFSLGAAKVVPYGKLDLTEYTRDLNGNTIGRVYGGAGVAATLPLSRLYPNAESELFNVKGIYHKIVFGANYYNAWTNTRYFRLPQLDRLDDDATDQARMDIKPLEPAFVSGGAGLALAKSPLFDPQVYAIRRLIDWRTDTLDNIQVVQAAVNQRWQTLRGYPGMEHTVDWLTLDVSASFFPAPNRDNFGEAVSFIEYNSTWAVGDRTGIVSSGWFDPFDIGTRYWTVGTYLDRPDRTHFYFGYRQFDPLNSRVLTGAVTYVFSPKYAITASAAYDFGLGSAISNSLMLTRMGTDLQLSIGVTYNSLINNFGIAFQIVPNLGAPRTAVYAPGAGMMAGR